MSLIFAYFVYLPILLLVRFIFRVTSPIWPKKISLYFKLKNHLPKIPALPDRPILIHASSGEIEYAKALIRKISQDFPRIPIVITFSSVSGERLVGKVSEATWVSPLPYDLPWIIDPWIQSLNPRAVIVAKTDFWYFFLKAAAGLKIPTILLSYDGANNKSFWRKANLKFFSHIFTLNSETEVKLREMGFPSVIAGDTRVDQALFRRDQHRGKSIPHASNFQCRLIAGSTWPEDERVLVSAIEKLPMVQFFIVPHETSTSHLANLEEKLKIRNISFERWTQEHSKESQVIIVDTWGVLADLYQSADVAFIGGSFKGKVHSVMEALVWGCPILVGPYYENNAEAKLLAHHLEKNWPVVKPVNTPNEMINYLSKFVLLPVDEKAQLKIAIRKRLNEMGGASEQIFEAIKKIVIFS